MICTESEYRNSRTRLEQTEQVLREQEVRLRAEGLDDGQIKRALDPIRDFQDQVKFEIECYEANLKPSVDEELKGEAN